MRKYTWDDYYDNFWDWSDSTRKSRISSLENIGPGNEIVEVIWEIEDHKVRTQLINKSIKMGAKFTHEDFIDLYGELPDETYKKLADYTGYDYDDPYFDEDNMTWDDFYNSFQDWDKEKLNRRINKLKHLGPNEEIVDAIQLMPDLETGNLFYEKAIASGVRFSADEQFDIGNWNEAIKESLPTKQQINSLISGLEKVSERLQVATQQQKQKESNKGLGFWAALAAMFDGINSTHRSHRCDGNCAACPPHYGYRYGRWYYGHGHIYGCEFGGNKGDGSL